MTIAEMIAIVFVVTLAVGIGMAIDFRLERIEHRIYEILEELNDGED